MGPHSEVSLRKKSKKPVVEKDFGPVLFEELSSLRRHSVILFHSERYPNKISEWTLRAEPKRETKYYVCVLCRRLQDKGRRENPPVNFGTAARILVRNGRFLVHPDYPRSEHICGFAENPMSDRAYVLARRAMIRARAEISEDGMLPKQKITEVIMRFRTEEKYAHLSDEEIKRMEDIARGNASNRGWADSSVARSFYLNRRKLTSSKYYEPRKVLECPIVGCDFLTTAPGMIDVHISEYHKTADGIPEPKSSHNFILDDDAEFCSRDDEEEWEECIVDHDEEVISDVLSEGELEPVASTSAKHSFDEEVPEPSRIVTLVSESPGEAYSEVGHTSPVQSEFHEEETLRSTTSAFEESCSQIKEEDIEMDFGPVAFKTLSSQATSLIILYHSKRFPRKISEWSRMVRKVTERSRPDLFFCVLCQRVKQKNEHAKQSGSCEILASVCVVRDRFQTDPDDPQPPHICDFENNPLADSEVVLMRRPLARKVLLNEGVALRKRSCDIPRNSLQIKRAVKVKDVDDDEVHCNGPQNPCLGDEEVDYLPPSGFKKLMLKRCAKACDEEGVTEMNDEKLVNTNSPMQCESTTVINGKTRSSDRLKAGLKAKLKAAEDNGESTKCQEV